MSRKLATVVVALALLAAVPAVALAHHVEVVCYDPGCSSYDYREYHHGPYVGDRYCWEHPCGGRYGYPLGHPYGPKGYWHKHVEVRDYWHWHSYHDEGPTPLGSFLLGAFVGLMLGIPVQ